MNGLVVEGLRAGYGAVNVLHDVSITVREGELVALLGMNGNGKSTLLNADGLLVKPSAGSIRLPWRRGESWALTGQAPHRIVDLGIGYVPEGRRLVPAPDRREESEARLPAAGRRPISLRISISASRPSRSLKERRRQLAGTMSGAGSSSRVARALMTSPRIMVIDEPSVGLAPIVVDQMIATIKELQTKRRTVILMAEQSFFQAVEVASLPMCWPMAASSTPSSTGSMPRRWRRSAMP